MAEPTLKQKRDQLLKDLDRLGGQISEAYRNSKDTLEMERRYRAMVEQVNDLNAKLRQEAA